ncbi:hypothetical protein CEXT_737361 [Caerostris extrusa]|uniref:Uncharacterized protein n=1 Tax=Caerostris extrusa TaxID=172846 RepID=A0AAV4WTN4_CAEEX|nr:hypothetical protein CEXT_737361 [Caerostris extrusa]
MVLSSNKEQIKAKVHMPIQNGEYKKYVRPQVVQLNSSRREDHEPSHYTFGNKGSLKQCSDIAFRSEPFMTRCHSELNHSNQMQFRSEPFKMPQMQFRSEPFKTRCQFRSENHS